MPVRKPIRHAILGWHNAANLLVLGLRLDCHVGLDEDQIMLNTVLYLGSHGRLFCVSFFRTSAGVSSSFPYFCFFGGCALVRSAMSRDGMRVRGSALEVNF